MVVRKLFRIAFAFALLVKAHRIARFSHRIRISHSHRTFRIFALFPPFWSIFHQKVVKSARKIRKICKKKSAKKCEMRMWCENGIKIRIASHYYNKIFFAFSHRIRIALPSLATAASLPQKIVDEQCSTQKMHQYEIDLYLHSDIDCWFRRLYTLIFTRAFYFVHYLSNRSLIWLFSFHCLVETQVFLLKITSGNSLSTWWDWCSY